MIMATTATYRNGRSLPAKNPSNPARSSSAAGLRRIIACGYKRVSTSIIL
jgi:hypothetical protein